MILEHLKNNKKTLIISAAVIAFAVLLYIAMNPEKTDDMPVSPDKLVQFDGSELEEKKDGKLVWKLTADKIMLDPDTQIIYFDNPKALVYDDDGTETTITSPKGTLDRTKKLIQIQPQVHAVTDKGDTLQTDGTVYYNMDTRMIKGGKVIMQRHDNTGLEADSFETNSSLDKVVLTGHAKVTKGEE
ncbi:MAG: LPS export ABC transporter periplasmic protein LptC [Megasphaera sp.]|nr:LPS export ABC transporter periplasmic protein LptC [Megasphaera sp.]MCH4187048.1 LPS export ABC transporter periplasmic protein LptC [Megasphaera sp.]MCH4217016.1 LPS export ABC transporter periplasmic protein LptC [Megasphaera sp.]